MRELIITQIVQGMLGKLNNSQLLELKSVVERTLAAVEITSKEDTVTEDNSKDLLNAFISAKRIEGCSEKSLMYYKKTIETMIEKVAVPVQCVNTDEIRNYLTEYQSENNISKVTVDNVRRILSSFFSWLEDEDYIIKNPIRRIHKVKTIASVKETYTDENLENMRDSCDELRDLALIDILASTGMRIGELVLLNKDDINFEERECVVFGKGSKERFVYFDARTKIHLKEYLDSRTDEEEALFVSLRAPYSRLTIGGIEARLRKMGKQLGIYKLHPHKFRRTLATVAIDKGMPIEQLQVILGHKRIDTTLQYAMVKQSNVKSAHRKYIG